MIGENNDNGVQSSFAFPVTSEVVLGIDLLGVHGHDSPNDQVPCFATSAGCGFSLTKLCDFDPSIAGIFSVEVATTGDNGQCANHDSLAGERQWAVATINVGVFGRAQRDQRGSRVRRALVPRRAQTRALQHGFYPCP